MRDDAYPFYAQQWSSAILRMIQPLLEIGKRVARKIGADLPRNRRPQRFFQHGSHQPRHAFGSLQGNIADKSVGHDHIDMAVV